MAFKYFIFVSCYIIKAKLVRRLAGVMHVLKGVKKAFEKGYLRSIVTNM